MDPTLVLGCYHRVILTTNFDMYVFPLRIDSQLQTVMERAESLGETVPIVMCVDISLFVWKF